MDFLDRPPRATVDFETRSACDIREAGTWRYSVDPSTEAMCLAYRLPYWEKGRTELWHPAIGALETSSMPPDDLFEWIAGGGLVEAHNVLFEICIWRNVMERRHGWPAVPLHQWRCSASKAAAHSLPRALDEAVHAMRLPAEKDAEGAKLMKKMSKPRKLLKAEEGTVQPDFLGHYWHETEEQLLRLFEYCRRDVLAEEGLSEALLDLSPEETEVFLMDLEINLRGFQLDPVAVRRALALLSVTTIRLNGELRELTGGAVEKATQRAKMQAWLETRGLSLPDTQGATLDAAVAKGIPDPAALRGVELMRALGRSSTAKYEAMDAWADPGDWRVRGGLMYHGASTGRWTGKGVQPHNFVRGALSDPTLAWEVMCDDDLLPAAEALWGVSLHELLSWATRGAIVAPEGRELHVSDFAAIEARVVMWLAGEEEALGVFRRHEDIYLDMARDVYGREVTKKDKTERQMGKQAILGLGYGMGAQKFKDTVAKYGIRITLEFAKQVVDAYRAKYARVRSMWYAQEEAAAAAVPGGRTVRCGLVSWRRVGRFLYCRLPSGRRLAYCDPSVVLTKTPWDTMKPTVTFMGVNPYSRQWQRQRTYGGMLVENITQAVARDLMAEAMVRLHRARKAGALPYDVTLSVHDELVAEADRGKGDARQFGELMAQLPAWAEGCPVECEAWSGPRYKK